MDGVEDRSAIEIMRPKELAKDVPAIIAPSPYYTSACGQFVGECIGDLDDDGLNDRWPLWYDNYFVPARVRGDPRRDGRHRQLHRLRDQRRQGGRAVHRRSSIDWLNGRIPGYTKAAGTDSPDHRDLAHRSKAAMIGRSYNGTLPNAVAATGVEGLTTIVPISRDLLLVRLLADGRRSSAARSTTRPGWPTTSRTRRGSRSAPRSAPTWSLIDGDADGNMNAFWDERNYRPDADKVKASVFATHCLQDDNVDPDQSTEWWSQLAKPRRPAQAVAVPRGPHRPVHDQPRGVDAPAPRLVRPLAARRSRTGSWKSPAWTSRTRRTTGPSTRTGRSPAPPRPRLYLRGDTQTTAGTIGGQPGGKTDTLTLDRRLEP